MPKKYAVLMLNTETGRYNVVSGSTRLSRYEAAKRAQVLRDDLNDPFEGIGQDRVIIAPRGR